MQISQDCSTHKGKVHPITCHWGTGGKKRYSSALSLISALDVGWVVNATHQQLYPRKEARYPLYRRLGELQGRSKRVRKISPPPGFDPGTIKSVASRYTDYAMPAHLFHISGVNETNIRLKLLNILPRRQVRTTTAHLLRLELPGRSQRLRWDGFPNSTGTETAYRSAFTCFIYWLSAVTLPSSRLLSLPRPAQLRIVGRKVVWRFPRLTTPPLATISGSFWFTKVSNLHITCKISDLIQYFSSWITLTWITLNTCFTFQTSISHIFTSQWRTVYHRTKFHDLSLTALLL